MKASLRFRFALSLCLAACYAINAAAQCPEGGTLQQLTYDTMTYGNGSNTYNFTFPKFDPELGTLMSARITTRQGLRYTYILENTADATQTYRTRAIRMMGVTSDALPSGDITAIRQENYYEVTIPGHGRVTRGPINLTLNSNYPVPFEDMINFMGEGVVDYTMVNVTVTAVEGSDWSLINMDVVDTTRFSITYTYCAATVMSMKQNNKVRRDVNRETEESVKVFPNPATNRFTLTIPEKEKGSFEVTVYNVNGQPAFQQKYAEGGSKNIALPASMSRGLYVVETKNTLTGNKHLTKLFLN